MAKIMGMTKIAENIAKLQERIELICQKYQRNASDILLLAVSKKMSADAIGEAYEAGISAFGESYAQELVSKQQILQGLNIEWHFIGRLQTNKIKLITSNLSWLHGLDSEQKALKLNDYCHRPLNVCIQVNVSDEISKGGIEPHQVAALAEKVAKLPNLKLRGLMTLPERSNDPETQRKGFAKLAACLGHLQQDGYDVDTLSMGMSNDFESAIAEGATIIRLGTAIFGPRL